MNKEKLTLSFIATLIGLLVAGVIFYLYQAGKSIGPSKSKTISIVAPSPTPKPSIFLSLVSPADEQVANKRIITIAGKTTPDATIVVLTKNTEEILTPAKNGDFSTTLNLEDGQNLIEVTAIAPNGESEKLTKTITFSTEEF